MTPPPIITSAGRLLADYDVILCDVWGVVHNGRKAFDKACAALIRFRGNGGTVILVSNAPVPKHRVASMLDMCSVPTEAWDDIISSGDIALRHINEAGYRHVYYIGPKDRDAAFFEKSPARPAAIDNSEAVVCTGLNDDRRETAEDYRPLLKEALTRKLPFVCANPDLVVDVGGTHLICAGAIADLYERMGGEVFWAGKPHTSAYSSAMAATERIRGRKIAKARALVIGDAVRTDIEGARRSGLDAIFIAGGIHYAETVVDGVLSEKKLAQLFKPDAPPARAAMIELAW